MAEIEENYVIIIALIFFRMGWREEENLTQESLNAGQAIGFFSPSVLCAKSGTVGNHLDRLSFYYPFLIGLQPLTQSVRPSNTLHLLHNNTQTL